MANGQPYNADQESLGLEGVRAVEIRGRRKLLGSKLTRAMNRVLEVVRRELSKIAKRNSGDTQGFR